jgi:hypothetical protein
MWSQVQLYLEDLQSYQNVTFISLTLHETDRIKPISLLFKCAILFHFKENEYFSINQMCCNQIKKIK